MISHNGSHYCALPDAKDKGFKNAARLTFCPVRSELEAPAHFSSCRIPPRAQVMTFGTCKSSRRDLLGLGRFSLPPATDRRF